MIFLMVYLVYGYQINESMGFVRDKYMSYITSQYRVYEYEDGKIGPESYRSYLCIQAAGAMAVGIRIGKKISVSSVEKYFYKFRGNRAPSMQDWINASNRYHIQDLNVKVKTFNNMNRFFKIVKKAIDNDYPVTVLLKKYNALVHDFNAFNLLNYDNVVDLINILYYSRCVRYNGYKFLNCYFSKTLYSLINPSFNDLNIALLHTMFGQVGHSVVIVGYIVNNGTIYYAVRDPYKEYCDTSLNDFCFFFDYLINEKDLEENIEKGNTILIFKTNPNVDLPNW